MFSAIAQGQSFAGPRFFTGVSAMSNHANQFQRARRRGPARGMDPTLTDRAIRMDRSISDRERHRRNPRCSSNPAGRTYRAAEERQRIKDGLSRSSSRARRRISGRAAGRRWGKRTRTTNLRDRANPSKTRPFLTRTSTGVEARSTCRRREATEPDVKVRPNWHSLRIASVGLRAYACPSMAKLNCSR